MTVSQLSRDHLLNLLRFLEQEGGYLAIYRELENERVDGEGNRSITRAGWTIALEFGREAADSNMAAGASYAAESDLFVALAKVAKEVRA